MLFAFLYQKPPDLFLHIEVLCALNSYQCRQQKARTSDDQEEKHL